MSADDRIRITCPKCHQKLRVKAAAAGKRARCPSAACGAVITIPSASHTDPESPRHQPRRPAEPFHFADASHPDPEPPRPQSHTRPWIWIAGGAVAVVLVTSLALAIGLGGWLTRGSANKGPDAVGLRPGEVDDKTLTKDGPGQPVPQATADKPDDMTLPRDGPSDPALTYDEVSKNPAKHRGKRVAWPFVFCSNENETALGSLDAPAARRPGAYGMYLVKFSSTQEAANDRILGDAFSGGGTITGTVAGEVETGLASRDRFGALLEKIPKARLPLLLYPVYKPPEMQAGPPPGSGTV